MLDEDLQSVLGENEIRSKKGFGRSKKSRTPEDLFNEQVEEQRQRRRFRWIMFGVFVGFLLGQHFGIGWFITVMIERNQIVNIQPLLAIILPATLGETYAVMRVMVSYVFSPGDFQSHQKKK